MRKFSIGLASGLLAAAVVLGPLPAAAAEFASSYTVEGSDPGGGSKYTGDVKIKRTSDATFEVVWLIGKDKFVGTGIGGPEGLAVAYKSGTSTGIAIFSQEGDGAVTGYWTYAGGKQVGEEKWTPK